MGRGDKKTAKGKRFKGSYGVARKKKTSTPVYVAKPKKAKAETADTADTAEKKAATKKTTKKATPAKKTTKKPAAKK